MNLILKKISAWLPIMMSFAALSLVLGYVALFGISREVDADEGAAAHAYQLLIAGQVPIILFFIIKWLPQKPKQGLIVIALQVVAIGVAFVTLYFFEL